MERGTAASICVPSPHLQKANHNKGRGARWPEEGCVHIRDTDGAGPGARAELWIGRRLTRAAPGAITHSLYVAIAILSAPHSMAACHVRRYCSPSARSRFCMAFLHPEEEEQRKERQRGLATQGEDAPSARHSLNSSLSSH